MRERITKIENRTGKINGEVYKFIYFLGLRVKQSSFPRSLSFYRQRRASIFSQPTIFGKKNLKA
jgi:hypothetical protein